MRDHAVRMLVHLYISALLDKLFSTISKEGLAMPKEYSEDLKRHVINRYEKGESILALSQELGISQTTIYRWRGEYCAVQTPGRVYTPKEIGSLVQHVKKLEDTLEVIRASGFISAVPLGDRLAFLEKDLPLGCQVQRTYDLRGHGCGARDLL